MSADLFAAFGGDARTRSELQGKPPAATSTTPSATQGTSTDVTSARAQQSTITSASLGRGESLWQSGSTGNDVLFDAENETPEDDFGDFENAHQPSVTSQITQPQQDAVKEHTSTVSDPPQETLVDLLSTDDEQPTMKMTKDRIEESTEARAPERTMHLQETKGGSGSDTRDDDTWGDFEAIEQQQAVQHEPQQRPPRSIPPKSTPPKAAVAVRRPPQKRSQLEPDDKWEAFDKRELGPVAVPSPVPALTFATPQPHSSRLTSAAPSHLPNSRPTNVPPPAILLSLLPIVFQDLLASITSATIHASDLAPRILTAHHTTARIIAGRSLRWKRDTILAQSTRIATAGKPGGMKLASVNRGESAKEQREAAEAVEVWNRSMGKWRGVVTNARMGLPTIGGGVPGGLHTGGGLKLGIPSSVKVANGPGVMESKVICALCGLKRSERVVGVDEGVEDVFGEYWVESWGHRQCLEWWERWKGDLGQR